MFFAQSHGAPMSALSALMVFEGCPAAAGRHPPHTPGGSGRYPRPRHRHSPCRLIKLAGQVRAPPHRWPLAPAWSTCIPARFRDAPLCRARGRRLRGAGKLSPRVRGVPSCRATAPSPALAPLAKTSSVYFLILIVSRVRRTGTHSAHSCSTGTFAPDAHCVLPGRFSNAPSRKTLPVQLL